MINTILHTTAKREPIPSIPLELLLPLSVIDLTPSPPSISRRRRRNELRSHRRYRAALFHHRAATVSALKAPSRSSVPSSPGSPPFSVEQLCSIVAGAISVPPVIPSVVPLSPPLAQDLLCSVLGLIASRFFNLSSEATLDDVVEKGRTFCGKKWDVAKKSVAPQPFIEQYCFRAPYIASLLREGLRITDDQIPVGSGSITWTLGVALLEAGKAYSTGFGFRGLELLPMKINPLILFLILLLSLIILLCALSCVGNSIPRFFRRKYLPIFRHSNVSSASVLNIPSPFQFQRCSPINSRDGRIKMPLSPTVACSQGSPFGVGHGLGDEGGGIQLMESSLYPSVSSFSHSFSSTSLGQMQFAAILWAHSGLPIELRCGCSVGSHNLVKTWLPRWLKHIS
ncbi:probable apyrase 7 [Arachis hypogaea]